jgi:hypothetical protein
MTDFKKRTILPPLPVPQERPKKPPQTEHVRAVSMPGKTLTSRLIKPVGAALLLLTTACWATTTVLSAPQQNKPATFPFGCTSITCGAAAPFTCSATTAGIYLDTTCMQVCACNPGQAKWCRSDTGACTTATDCC